MRSLAIIASGLLIWSLLSAARPAGAQPAPWMRADAQAEAARRDKDFDAAAEHARRAIELYERKTGDFDAVLYVSLVDRAARVHACRGDGPAAAFAVAEGIAQVIERAGRSAPELLQLYEIQARYYDLMFDNSKTRWRLQTRIALAERLFAEGSDERLGPTLDLINWSISRRQASPEALRERLESATRASRGRSVSSHAWGLDARARIAAYAGETRRAEEISTEILELARRFRDSGAILPRAYSRLARIYLRSGRKQAFLEILSRAAAQADLRIRDAAIVRRFPGFSREAAAAGLFAKFTLDVDVEASGRVRDVVLRESNANETLEREFLAAVREFWYFPPGLDEEGVRVPRRIARLHAEFPAPDNARRFAR